MEIAEEMVGALREEVSSEPLPTPVEKTGSTEISIPRSTAAAAELIEITEELIAPSAAVESEIAAEPETKDIIELTLDAVSDDGILSTPEQNQKNGSTWVLIIVALIIGVAIGAGYVSYRTGS